MTYRPPLVGALLLGLAACGLSVVGQGLAEDGTAPTSADASAVEDATRPGVDAAVVCDAGLGAAAVVILPAGGAACPSGTTERIVRTAPVAAAGACSCGTCTPTTAPSCAGNDLGVSWGSNDACGASSDSFDITDGACIDWGYGIFDLVQYHRWQARTPTAGACTAAKVEDAAKVTSTEVRTCTGAAEGVACTAVLAGARVCTESAGGACAAPFSVELDVGDGVSLACGDCGCTHAATKCTVEYHGDATCTQLKYTTEANGVCTRTNDAQNVQYLKVYPGGVTCTATAGAPTTSLTNPRRLCCTP